jgi:hypothetical protein
VRETDKQTESARKKTGLKTSENNITLRGPSLISTTEVHRCLRATRSNQLQTVVIIIHATFALFQREILPYSKIRIFTT